MRPRASSSSCPGASTSTRPPAGCARRITEAPQLPFEDLNLELFKGTLAPLRTPVTCGTFGVETVLTPWSAPEGALRRPKDAFTIEKGAGAGPCAADAASVPEATRFSAGTLEPSAGTYSPFILKLARPDGSRLLSGIETTLPEGVLAKIAGLSSCSEGALAAAAANTGAAESRSPSCPAASRIGSLDAAAGAGPSPYNLTGAAYLAGPYAGAPLSLALVTPALAGPFDLGTVVTRVALHPDPRTTRVRAVSDPFPATLRSVPLDLRSVTLTLDPGFAKNPTSCYPAGVHRRRPDPERPLPGRRLSQARLQAEARAGAEGLDQARRPPGPERDPDQPRQGHPGQLRGGRRDPAPLASLRQIPPRLGGERLRRGHRLDAAARGAPTGPGLSAPLLGNVHAADRRAGRPGRPHPRRESGSDQRRQATGHLRHARPTCR